MEIRVACSPGERRVAVMQGDVLADYAIARPGAPDGLGDVHLGRILSRVPAMAGAFVALHGGAEGFLPDSEGAQTEGEAVVVRVVRSAQGGKGPRLARHDGMKVSGREAPALLARGPDALARLASRHPGADILVDDPAVLAELRPALGDRVRMVATAFDEVLESEIADLAEANISLPGGMRASIVATPALVAIDLDGGSTTGARGAKAVVQVAANHACLPELGRQIVLRNLSGAILIDFAGVPAKRRQALRDPLVETLAADWAAPRLLGFTALGFAEILRPRHHPPLHESLRGPHAAGLAALREAGAGDPGRRMALRAHPAVVTALRADSCAMADLARRLTHPLILASDPASLALHWTLADAPHS